MIADLCTQKEHVYTHVARIVHHQQGGDFRGKGGGGGHRGEGGTKSDGRNLVVNTQYNTQMMLVELST